MSQEKSRFDLQQTLTNQIIAAIERVSAEDFLQSGCDTQYLLKPTCRRLQPSFCCVA